MNQRLNIAIARELYGIEFCLNEYEVHEDTWFKKRAGGYFDRAMDLIYIRDGIGHRQKINEL